MAELDRAPAGDLEPTIGAPTSSSSASTGSRYSSTISAARDAAVAPLREQRDAEAEPQPGQQPTDDVQALVRSARRARQPRLREHLAAGHRAADERVALLLEPTLGLQDELPLALQVRPARRSRPAAARAGPRFGEAGVERSRCVSSISAMSASTAACAAAARFSQVGRGERGGPRAAPQPASLR